MEYRPDSWNKLHILLPLYCYPSTKENYHQPGRLDFGEAFDPVPHQRLLSKLNWFGMRGSTHSCIEDVLRQRTQEDIVGGHSSRSPEVTSGVPQGTVLDPPLFLTLINDLSDCVSSSLILFADDCLPHMWISGPEDAQDAQYLDRLQPWQMDWQMYSNPSKCQVITITTNKNQLSYD